MIWFKSSFRGIMFNDVLDVNGPQVFAAPGAADAKARALDRDGKPFELEADGLLAICIQHEMDHLVGKLFIDYLSPLKQQRIRQKVEKLDRLRSRA